MKKISIIGAGNVGANVAVKIAERNLVKEIVILDIVEGIARGKALDLAESSSIMGFQTKISGTRDYKAIEDSQLIIVTAGYPRKPGMVRRDLVEKNSGITALIAKEIKENAPEAIIINVTNPLDEMTYLIYALGNFLPNQVLGMAGVLDSSRLCYFISEILGIPPQSIEATVLGGHGETMVSLMRLAKVGGKPISDKLTVKQIEEVIERTRHAGAEIVSLLGKGSAYYAPSAAVYEMARAIIEDTKRVLPCSICLSGEYGYEGIFLGVPVSLGKDGVEKIIELKLNSKEKEALNKSAEVTRKGIEELKEEYNL